MVTEKKVKTWRGFRPSNISGDFVRFEELERRPGYGQLVATITDANAWMQAAMMELYGISVRQLHFDNTSRYYKSATYYCSTHASAPGCPECLFFVKVTLREHKSTGDTRRPFSVQRKGSPCLELRGRSNPPEVSDSPVRSCSQVDGNRDEASSPGVADDDDVDFTECLEAFQACNLDARKEQEDSCAVDSPEDLEEACDVDSPEEQEHASVDENDAATKKSRPHVRNRTVQNRALLDLLGGGPATNLRSKKHF